MLTMGFVCTGQLQYFPAVSSSGNRGFPQGITCGRVSQVVTFYSMLGSGVTFIELLLVPTLTRE